MACTKHELVQGEPYEPRRVIIVVGDGNDNASKKSIDEVLEVAQRNLVTIYAMSTQAFGFANDTQDVLERLTSETGGHVEYPLNSLYKDVSGYLSNPSDDGNYALTVGTGGYAAEISGAIIKAVGGIGGEVTTQYVRALHSGCGPGGEGQGVPPHQGGNTRLCPTPRSTRATGTIPTPFRARRAAGSRGQSGPICYATLRDRGPLPFAAGTKRISIRLPNASAMRRNIASECPS